jgi:hypothetical protein
MTTLHQSPFTIITLTPDKSLLRAVWLPAAAQMEEQAVIHEISQVLEAVEQQGVKGILVDVRNYPFQNNERIQSWINFTYMPRIVESGVLFYALIVEKKRPSLYDNTPDLDDVEEETQVEYFTDPAEAEKWLANKLAGK